MSRDRPTMSVVVPTHRRPDVLLQCLDSLNRLAPSANEVVVSRRVNDSESIGVIRDCQSRLSLPLVEVVVGEQDNLRVSLNAAISATTGEFVALTDDDAEFPVDWLDRLLALFDSDIVAGVGGRDQQPGSHGRTERVGVVQWHGRVIGNHHTGDGPARDVDVLKGVNVCFRGTLLREIGIDNRLRGTGNVAQWEMAICLALRARGYHLRYDPSIEVIHHIAPRGDGDQSHRGGFNANMFRDSLYNETLVVAEYLPPVRQAVYVAYSFLVGTTAAPGLLQVPRAASLRHGWGHGMSRWWHASRARLAAFSTVGRKPPDIVS